MALVINIPPKTEESLRAEWGKLEQAALEALLIESYRSAKLSLGALAEAMGMRVLQADQWLAARGVTLNYGPSDLHADRDALKDLLGDQRR